MQPFTRCVFFIVRAEIVISRSNYYNRRSARFRIIFCALPWKDLYEREWGASGNQKTPYTVHNIVHSIKYKH